MKTEKFLLKLYNVMIVLFMVIFTLTTLRIITDIVEATPFTYVENIGYLMILNQNVILYNQTKRKIEVKEQETN